MSVSEKIAEIQKCIAEYETIRSALSEDVSKNFKVIVEGLLRENHFPYLVVSGYTPSFNDGDPCTFTLNCDIIYGEGTEYVIEQFDNADWSNIENIDVEGELKESAHAIEKTISTLEELLELSFGSYGWRVLAGIDADGNFHYHLDTDYDCGY